MSQKILVVGSANTDMVVRTKNFPQPGETILGGSFLMNPGGKGANQAVAAVRLGAQVRFACKLGKDIFGQQAKAGFEQEGLDTRFVATSEETASGVALITVNEAGENEIVVASGANMELTADDLPDAIFDDMELIVAQLEIPIPTVVYLAQEALERHKKFILNPAPAYDLPAEVYHDLFLITPNETETKILTGVFPDSPATCAAAAARFIEMGVKNVIVTLGSKGVYLHTEDTQEIIPAIKVTPLDTTAAGDVFNGALAVGLSEGRSIKDACIFATKAAGIAVTRAGAQASAPYRRELES